MALAAVSVTTAVTDIVTPPADGTSALWKFLHVANVSSNIVYLKYDGSSTTLTTANGFPLYPGQTLQLDNDGIKHIYQWGLRGIAGSTSEVRVIYN